MLSPENMPENFSELTSEEEKIVHNGLQKRVFTQLENPDCDTIAADVFSDFVPTIKDNLSSGKKPDEIIDELTPKIVELTLERYNEKTKREAA